VKKQISSNETLFTCFEEDCSWPAPEVTILIPAYNHARFLARGIQSALSQDFPSFEVVVCDDESTDDTEDVVRAFSHDRRLRYIRRPSNVGRVANYRQALVENATGQWVVMLDGDDYLSDPCFITKAMQALATHAEAEPVFVQAGQRVVREPSLIAKTSLRPFVDIFPDIPGQSQVMTGGEYLSFVYETGFFTHLGTLYRRDAALRHGFYTSDISSSDMDSILRLALTGNVVLLKLIAGCWVQHGGNASNNVPLDRIEENVRIFRRIACQGAAAGLVDLRKLERMLTRYEAHTLAHLFGTTIGKSSSGLSHALTMLWIMVRVNPRVCFERRLRKAWLRHFKRLRHMSIKRVETRIKKVIAFQPSGDS
jgi:glycosyltransferase involved in cell wall biosynthesis